MWNESHLPRTYIICLDICSAVLVFSPSAITRAMLEALLASKKKDGWRSFCLHNILNFWALIDVPQQYTGQCWPLPSNWHNHHRFTTWYGRPTWRLHSHSGSAGGICHRWHNSTWGSRNPDSPWCSDQDMEACLNGRTFGQFPLPMALCWQRVDESSNQPQLHRLHLVLTEASKCHPRQKDHPAYPGGSAIGLLWGHALDGEERPVWEVRRIKLVGNSNMCMEQGIIPWLLSRAIKHTVSGHCTECMHMTHSAFVLSPMTSSILKPPNIRVQTRCLHHPRVYCTDIGTCETKIRLQATRRPQLDILTSWMRQMSWQLVTVMPA